VKTATYPKVIVYDLPVAIDRLQGLPAAIVRLSTPNLKSYCSVKELADNQQHTQVEKLRQTLDQSFDKISHCRQLLLEHKKSIDLECFDNTQVDELRVERKNTCDHHQQVKKIPPITQIRVLVADKTES
jgi:hypothetical protein